MSTPEHCRPQTLAQDGSVRVDWCGCVQVHVSIGPFTVRLPLSQYRTLCVTLGAATARLAESSETLPLH